MMVSLIQSNYMGFGSYVVVPGTGFGLQNRGAGFAIDEAHPNVVAPRKRPFHTIIPGFLTSGGAPVGPFGVMGGHMQPQGHLQVVSHMVDRGLDPQAALDEPRWRLDTGGRGEWSLALEEPLHGLAPELARRGHRVLCDPHAESFGGGQAVLVRDDVLIGGTESRKDGVVLGL